MIAFLIVIILILLCMLVIQIILWKQPNLFYRDMPTGLCEAMLPDKPNWVSSKVAVTDPHYIKPLPPHHLARYMAAAQSIDPSSYNVVNDGVLQGYRRTAFWGFTDWYCLYADGQITSSATMGHSDVGVNRQWVEAMRSKLLKDE